MDIVATVCLILFMLIPVSIKKIGVLFVVEEKKSGSYLILFSMILWWTAFVLLANVWVPYEYFIYTWLLVIAGVSFKVYKERKYLFFAVKKNLEH